MAFERMCFPVNANTVFDPFEFNKLKAESLNKAPKPDDGLCLPCSKCGGSGDFYIAKPDALRPVWTPCSCYYERQARRRLKNIGLLERAMTNTFQTFAASEPYQKDMKQKAMDFCEAEKKGWLMLCGQPGCGKTHLCVAVVGQLAKQGHDVQVMPWVNIAMALKNPDVDRNALLQPYKNAPVLYIDDFLKGNQTNTGYEAAFGLLNDRYNDTGLITVISTEKTPEDLGQFDQAIRGRIVERCGKYISVVAKVPGRDYRLKQ